MNQNLRKKQRIKSYNRKESMPRGKELLQTMKMIQTTLNSYPQSYTREKDRLVRMNEKYKSIV